MSLDSNNNLVSVVIPVHNEQDSVDELYRRIVLTLETHGYHFEIVFADDGSTDDSTVRIRKLALEDARIVLVELAKNYGQTAALAAGIDYAIGGIIVTLDGDLQHTPEAIPQFIEKLKEGYDIVSGWREVRTDNVVVRKIPSFIANRLARKLSGVNMKDFGSTFKAYRSSLLKRIELFGDMHRFIPILAYRMGAKIIEIPIEVHPRTKGSSKYGLFRTFGVFQDLIFLEFYSNHLTRPIRFFGGLFVFFFLAGFSISCVLMLLWGMGIIPAVFEHAALLLFSVFLMIVGIQMLLTGILAEILLRIYINTGNSKIYSIREVYRKKLVAAAG